MRPHEQLPLFIHWSAFLTWLLEATEKFPKNARFTLTQRIENYALEIYEGVVEARYTTKRNMVLKRMDLALEKLRLLLRLAHERKYLSHQSYEYSSRQLHEAGNMLGGWIRKGTVDETDR